MITTVTGGNFHRRLTGPLDFLGKKDVFVGLVVIVVKPCFFSFFFGGEINDPFFFVECEPVKVQL